MAPFKAANNVVAPLQRCHGSHLPHGPAQRQHRLVLANAWICLFSVCAEHDGISGALRCRPTVSCALSTKKRSKIIADLATASAMGLQIEQPEPSMDDGLGNTRVISPGTDAPMAAIDGGPCNAVLSTSAIPSHHGCEVRQGAVRPAIPQCPGRDRDGAICQPDTANAKGLGDHHMGGASPQAGTLAHPAPGRAMRCGHGRWILPFSSSVRLMGIPCHHPIHHRTPSIAFPLTLPTFPGPFTRVQGRGLVEWKDQALRPPPPG